MWECQVPGPAGSVWEGATVQVTLEVRLLLHRALRRLNIATQFTEAYPVEPPIARFAPGTFHLNIFSCGTVCLSLLDADGGMGFARHRRSVLQNTDAVASAFPFPQTGGRRCPSRTYYAAFKIS